MRAFLTRRGLDNFALVLRYLFVTVTPFPLYHRNTFSLVLAMRTLGCRRTLTCGQSPCNGDSGGGGGGGGDALFMACVCDGLAAALC